MGLYDHLNPSGFNSNGYLCTDIQIMQDLIDANPSLSGYTVTQL